MTRLVICISLIISLASHLSAASLQYDLATGDVTAARDAPIPEVSGYGVVTIPEPVASIQWPLPVGCAVSNVRYQWVTITNASLVDVTGAGMAIRAAIVPFLFSTSSTLLTGCHYVGSWSQLRRLYRQTIAQVVVGASDDEAEMIAALNDVQLWVMRRCPESVGSANCITARGNLLTMDGDYRGAGQAADLTTQLVTLRNDVLAFKAAQGW